MTIDWSWLECRPEEKLTMENKRLQGVKTALERFTMLWEEIGRNG